MLLQMYDYSHGGCFPWYHIVCVDLRVMGGNTNWRLTGNISTRERATQHFNYVRRPRLVPAVRPGHTHLIGGGEDSPNLEGGRLLSTSP